MTLTIGAWIIPTFITVLSFVVAVFLFPKRQSDYDFGSGFIALLLLAAAAIVSLIAWFVWALI